MEHVILRKAVSDESVDMAIEMFNTALPEGKKIVKPKGEAMVDAYLSMDDGTLKVDLKLTFVQQN